MNPQASQKNHARASSSLWQRVTAELDRCVHCGLCLNQCPTYRVLHLETESPRGRIHLVRAAAEGRIEAGERFGEHLYLCLLCRACESACPSGVHYGRIAEAAREVLGPPGAPLARGVTSFVLKQILPFPARLRSLARVLRLYQRIGLGPLARPFLPAKLRQMEELLPKMPERFFKPNNAVLKAIGEERARVGLLSGCVMSVMFPEINQATVRVLRRNGCAVVIPPNQTCCGALNVHCGEKKLAQVMARRNIDAFLDSGVSAVIVNAAGCGAAMKEYGYLLGDDPAYAEKAQRFSSLVEDAAAFLVRIGLRPATRKIEMSVTYQDPCHLAHGQKIRAEPRALLASIPGLRLIEMESSDRCCGSAGIYNLLQPEMSQELLKEKMAAVAMTGATAVVAPNPGCLLQLGYGSRRYGPSVRVMHLVDLLDQAYGPPVEQAPAADIEAQR